MKKGLAICCLCTVTIGLTGYFAVKSHANNSNASDSYEYYYNNNGVYKDDTSVDSAEQLDDLNENYESVDLPAHIDTDPTSLTVFVNKEYELPSDYIPKDLKEPDIPFYFSYYDEKRTLRAEAADALEQLVKAASDDGVEIVGVSGFRSYQRQTAIYNKNVRSIGKERTDMYSAIPGHSEHQTGWAIDLSCAAVHYDLDESFADTPEGKWLAKNCYRYGFIIRYPKGKEELTGYAYEPWHIRYLGVKLATFLTTNHMTLEDYYNYTPPKNSGVTGHDSLTSEADTVKDTTTPTARPTKKPSQTVSPTKTPTPDSGKDTNSDKKEEATTKTTKKPTATKNPSPSPSPTTKPTAKPTTKPTNKPTPKPTHDTTVEPVPEDSTPPTNEGNSEVGSATTAPEVTEE